MVIKVLDQRDTTMRLFTVKSVCYDATVGEAHILSVDDDRIILKMSTESYDILICTLHTDCTVDMTGCKAWVNDEPHRGQEKSVTSTGGMTESGVEEYPGFDYVLWVPVLVFAAPVLTLIAISLLKLFGAR